MALSVRTNVVSLNAQANLGRTQLTVQRAIGRLSSGLRINMAADDAAGLSISEKLRSQVRSLTQAKRNANDGISLLQTAEGAMTEVNDMLIRMRELAVQSANGTLGSDERTSINDEFTALKNEIDRITNVTEFNGTKLVDGTLSAGVTFQVGIKNTAANDRITVSIADTGSTAIGVTSGMSLSTVTKAQNAITLLDTAITNVNSRRGDIGAAQNRLRSTINNLSSSRQNLSAANSRIRDADIAKESASFTKNQILMRAGVSVLAQANSLPNLALQLLQ